MENVTMTRQLEAEYAVLGSILRDASIVGDVLAAVDPRDILHPSNQLIYAAIRDLFRGGEPVDAITLRNKLGGEFAKILVELMEVTPTAVNWREYAAIMHEQAALSRVRDIANTLITAATLEDCRPLIATLGEELSAGRNVASWDMATMLQEFVAQQTAGPESADYITYGLADVDGGTYTQRGNVVILGGRPSEGKTALALTMAYHMAGQHKVGFFSLETDHGALTDRMVAHRMQVSYTSINKRSLTEPDWEKVNNYVTDFGGRQLRVFEGSGMTATEIESVSRAYGFDVIFIDYLQLVTPEVNIRASRNDAIAEISRSLHIFAQRTKTLVVELSQLSRPEKGSWREPDLSDLRESGQLEQDADLVMFLYRPSPKSKLDRDRSRILKIAKNKKGHLGRWPLYFDGDHQTFATMADETGDSKALMQRLAAQGKAAKQRSRAQSPGQIQFRELTPEETGDLPF